MTKQEKIQEAWTIEQLHGKSEGVPRYFENGWAKYGSGSKRNSNYFKQLEEKQWLGYWFYRPKSLHGIETNNGWTKIESESDLPNLKGKLVIFRNKYKFLTTWESDEVQEAPNFYLRYAHWRLKEKIEEPLY